MSRIQALRDAARRAAWWSSTPVGLAWLFFAGAVIRLWLARGGGFPYDMQSFAGWADRLADRGPGGFYPPELLDPSTADGEGFFVDYPPGYLYVLWAVGKLAALQGRGAPSVFLLKLPPIVADLALAAIVVRLATRITPPALGRRVGWRGPAAAFILLNPAVFFVSAVWGQVDSVLALLMAGAFLLLATGETSFRREAGGMALLAVAVGTKPQGAFVLPLVLVVLVWRHVRTGVLDARGRDAREAVLRIGAATGRLVALGAVSAAAGLLLVAPFGLGIGLRTQFPFVGGNLFSFYAKASGTYKATSVFAFNFWGAGGFWKPDLEPTSGQPAVEILGIPALFVGLAAFAVGGAFLVWRAWRSLGRGELEARVLVFGGVAMTCLAYAVLTRIHERYLFLAVVLLVPFIAYPWLRRALIALSALFGVNVYFPYFYYVDGFEGRSAIRIPGFSLLYGSSEGRTPALQSVQLTLLSLTVAVVCLLVAALGWRWIEGRSVGVAESLPDVIDAPPEVRERSPAPPASFTLHSIGRRGVAWSVVVFAAALLMRSVGLGSPPGMYFDEVYHARTAGEYLQGREVYEWTHPPLAKEFMALSISALARYDVRGRAEAPDGMRPGRTAGDGTRLAWAVARGDAAGEVRLGTLGAGCRVIESGSVPLDIRPTAVAVSGNDLLVGGDGEGGPILVSVEGGEEVWRVPVGDVPSRIVFVGEAALVRTEGAQLWYVGAGGEDARALAAEVGALAAETDARRAWTSFPGQGQVVSWSQTGERGPSVAVEDGPGPLVAAGDRLLVAQRNGSLRSIDVGADPPTLVAEDLGAERADRLATIPQTGLVWALDGRDVAVIEPRGLSVIARASYPEPPEDLVASTDRRALAGLSSGRLSCLVGNAPFAWRFGSAVFASAMVALVFLLGLRLFGSLLAAAVAALLLAVDGLAFVLARIAMNDSYVAAFVLAAWLCALSALYHWGRAGPGADGRPPARNRAASLGFLAATGVFIGLGLASKWVALWGLVGIGVLLAWDAAWRRRDGILGLAGHPAATVAVGVLLGGVVPLAVYVATYAPYLGLGHTFAELARLQESMYSYHAHLDATHPYSSPWYGWPIGRSPVFLYLSDGVRGQAEIWTAGNPVVFLGGLFGLVAIGASAVRRRTAALAVPVLAALVQYLPWVFVGRVLFLYHYLPVVPFLCLGLGWWVAVGREPRSEKRRRIEVAVTLGAALVAFAVLLPLVDGWMVPEGYLKAVKDGLFAWMWRR